MRKSVNDSSIDFYDQHFYRITLRMIMDISKEGNKNLSSIGGITLVLLILASNISVTPIHSTAEKTFALEDEYIKLISSPTQSIANNNTNTNTTTESAQQQIPEAAKGPMIPEKGYLVKEIGNQLYWVTDGTYDTMFLVTDNGVVAVDAPPSLGEKYLKAISEVTDKPITHVIYSHAHIDHIGAASMFPTNATIIAQEDTADELQRAKAVATNDTIVPPVPTETFSKNMTLNIGNQTLQLDYYGINHYPGNIFIYAPNQKVLMLVDIVFPGWVPFAYLAIAKDTAGFIEAHDIALSNYDFSTLVAGHLTRIGTVEDVIIQREFVSDLENAAAAANKNVAFSEIARQVGSFDNPWLLFSKYIDAVNEECAEEMMPKWQDKLGGAEQFMLSHCFTMSESGRVDPTVMALMQNSTLSY